MRGRAIFAGVLLAAAGSAFGQEAQDLGIDDPIEYADNIPSGSAIDMRNGNRGDVRFELGFGISSGDERFIRLDMIDATFDGPVDETLFSCDDSAACAFALGAAGDDFIVVGLSAVGENLPPGSRIRFDLNGIDSPRDLEVPVTSGSVSINYRLYEDPVEANEPGGGSATLVELLDAIITFVDPIFLNVRDNDNFPGVCVADVTQGSLAFAPAETGRFPFQNEGASGDTRCFCNRIVQRVRTSPRWLDGDTLGNSSRPCPLGAPIMKGPPVSCNGGDRATLLILGNSSTNFIVDGVDNPLDFAQSVTAKGDLSPASGVFFDYRPEFHGGIDLKGVPTRDPDCTNPSFVGTLSPGNETATIDAMGTRLRGSETALCLTGNGVDPFPVDEYVVDWEVIDNDPNVEFDNPQRDLGTACRIEKNGSEDALVFNLTQGGFYTQFIRITNPTSVDGRVFLSCYDDANDQSNLSVSLDNFSDRDGEMLPAVLGANESTDLINIDEVWDTCGITPMGGPGSPNGNFLRLRAEGEFGSDGVTTGQGEVRGIRIEGVVVSRDGNSFENTSR